MAIPQSRYVSITSGTAGQSAIGERNLNGLVFTYGTGWIKPDPFDPDKLLICYSMNDVLTYFSSESDEAKFAQKYFAYISPSGTTPASLTFAKMKVTNSGGANLVYKSGGWYTTGVKASGTITIANTIAAADALTIGSTTYTFTTFRTGVNQVLIAKGANNTVDAAATAANLAEVINGTGGFYGQTAHPDVTATVANNVVTVTAIYYGLGGNSISLSTNEAEGITLSGGALSGGENGVAVSSGAEVYEAPIDALSRVDGGTNDFGSFAFVDPLGKITTAAEKAVAVQSAGYNYKYLFGTGNQVGANYSISGTTAKAATIGEVNGTAFTQGADPYGAAIPMAIFAATDYNGTNTATVYMFKQVPGEQPTVMDSQTADTLDGLHVNYYGLTHANGRQLAFYQRGVNLDGQDTAVYCNEVWLKSAIATAIMNLLVAVERIPANEDGESMLNSAITAMAQKGVQNGMMEIGKRFNEAQQAAIFQLTGDTEAVTTIQNSGYWLDVVVEEDGGEYKARYVLVYAKGDSVRKVEGRDILI